MKDFEEQKRYERARERVDKFKTNGNIRGFYGLLLDGELV